MSEGWPQLPLREICDVLDKLRKPITKRDRIAGDYPYYGATGILDYVEDYIFDELLILIGEDGAKWGAGENTAFAANGKYWVNNHAHVIRPHRDLVDDRWIIHYLNHANLSPFITGLTVPKLNQGKLNSIPIPLPPLAEQKRIVSILDEAFAAIAKAKENAERNLANAKELFESYLNKVFTEKGEGWEEKRIGDVVLLQGGSQPPKSTFIKEKKEGYIRLIQIRDYKSDKHIVFIPQDKAKRFCNEDDIMIGRYGPPLFQILRGIEGAYNVALMKALPDETTISKDYLYFFLQNRDLFNYINHSSSRTAGQTGFKKEVLEAYPIAFPRSFQSQIKIVDNLEALKSICQRLECLSERKLTNLDELKQSILQKAFTGQLTSKSPELESI